MIKTKQDLKFYLLCDKVALKIPSKRKYPRPVFDSIWTYEIILRKTEYHKNNSGIIHNILYIFYRVRLEKLGTKLSINILPNVFGPGLSIAHYGGIIVNPYAKVGCNCRIHEGVTIGSTNGSNKAAEIGDNCFLGSGAKIIGNIKIGNNIAVGAGAVVIKDINEDHVSVAGVPAKIISHNGSETNIIKATEIVRQE